MLSELQFPFSLMGLSEIKFNVNEDIITNVNIPGYDFISQPSLSNAGGVGFYRVSIKRRQRTQDLIHFKSINTKETVCYMPRDMKRLGSLFCSLPFVKVQKEDRC